MEHIDPPKFIPKSEGDLYGDAIIAWHGGKRLGACFYLRCFIEQFARRQTNLLKEKKTGDEIMDAYAELIPEQQRSQMPSLKHWYDSLSMPIHAADEELAEATFEKARDAIEQHFELRRAFRIRDNIVKVQK